MLVTAMPVFAVAAGAEEIDWTAKEITLYTSDDFVAFNAKLFAGEKFVGKTVKLGADIDLAGKNLQALDASKGFYGTFDGQFHVVRNLSISVTYGYIGAMFGAVGKTETLSSEQQSVFNGVTVKDFALVDADVTAGTRVSGMFSAVYNKLTVENVYIKASITSHNNADSSGSMVGYVWEESDITVRNCVFEGSVKNNGGAGAFVGQVRDNSAGKPAAKISIINSLNVSENPFVGAYASATSAKEVVTNSYKYDVGTMGTGSTATAPEGFTTRSTGYPIPTTLLPFFSEQVKKYVKFMYNGGVQLQTEITGESLTIEEFPSISGVDTVIWVNQATGAVVEAPITVTEDTVLVAKTPGVNETEVLGVQLGAVSGGKQGIRFIGGVFNLEGDAVGFEITVKYKDASGALVTRKYVKTVNKVYDSISATENGEMKNVTAKDLGAIYLYAVVLDGVPADAGQLDITVKSVKARMGGAVNIGGEEITVSVLDGVVNTGLTPLS